MKTATSFVVVACTLFSLIGCSNRTEVEILQPTRAAKSGLIQQSWRDILSCTDCEGIETSLLLEKDGTWMMNECHQGVRDEPSLFTSYGTWARTVDKLMLTSNRGEKPHY